jgi:hypothetical protein
MSRVRNALSLVLVRTDYAWRTEQRCILCWTDALPFHFGRIAVVDRKLNIVNGRRYSTFRRVKCVVVSTYHHK